MKPVRQAVIAALVLGVASPSLAAETAARPSPVKMSVDIHGPLAMVVVTRSLSGTRGDGGEALLDLALPERAALVGIDVNDGDRWRPADVVDPARGREAYRDSIRSRGITGAHEPFDDEAAYRIRIVHGPEASSAGRSLSIRYRFSAIVDAIDGRHRLRFPPLPELIPLPIDVTVSAVGLADVEIAGVRTTFSNGAGQAKASGRSSAHGGWEISYALRAPPGPAGGAPSPSPTLAGAAATAKLSDGESALAFAVHARAGRATALPERVLFLIDRSRSVGLPGLAAERDVARRVLETLPPATRFDALFFDRTVKRLFPMSRPATREAIAAIDAEMVPDRLANGTDLGWALRNASDLLRRETTAFAPRTLLVIITDGALPDDQTGGVLDRALGVVPGVELTVAALVVRAADEDSVAPTARQALRRLAETRGGIERLIRSNEIQEAVGAVMAGLGRGGDLFSVRLQAGSERTLLAEALAPAAGVSGVARWGTKVPRAVDLKAAARGQVATLAVRPRVVEADWLRPHAASAAPARTRLLSTTNLTALIEPVLRPAPPPPTAPPRGTMDRGVVRNTLALAYMPRARACYQNRSGATPTSRDLTGRVRLAIDLVRGEVAAAHVESSTLNQPEIEACLCEGAFALDVPRAYRNDAPVTAIMNMVFRPRTPEKKKDTESIGTEIDLVMEELHRTEGADIREDNHGRDQLRPPTPAPVP